MHTRNQIHTIYQHTATHLFVLIATLFMLLPAPLQAKVAVWPFRTQPTLSKSAPHTVYLASMKNSFLNGSTSRSTCVCPIAKKWDILCA